MRNDFLESAPVDGTLLRVEFTWLGDRFGHSISAVKQSGEIHPLLQSLEGNPTDNWPPSPPLQSLSIETLAGGRRAALLVGMAGGSHWSASIETTPSRAELLFDLACRHQKEPTYLGSTYRSLSGSRDKLFTDADDAQVLQSEDRITIESRISGHTKTHRWKYTLRLPSEF